MPRKTPVRLAEFAEASGASMRPRPDAAENGTGSAQPPSRWPGFNEAAARCRGKPGVHQDGRLRRVASMRPRPDAAENPRGGRAGD